MATMAAVQVSKAVAADQLQVSQVPVPHPGPGQVRVQLYAAALNHRDLHFLDRDLGSPVILGSDGAGLVDILGPETTGLEIGQPVIINPSLGWGDREDAYGPDFNILGSPQDGTLAEAVVVPVTHVHPKPEHLSFYDAAALPLAGLTAYRALFSRAGLQPGERVLIHGIGGGVALFALQFAVSAGAQVMVTSRVDAKLEKAARLGAGLGINSTTQDWAAAARDWSDGAGVDLVVESIGGEIFSQSVDVLRRGGRLVTFGRTASTSAEVNVGTVFWNQVSILGSTMGSPADFAAMAAAVTRYRLRPVVDSTWPLAEAGRAFQRLASQEQFGKVVLDCTGSSPS